MRACACVCIYTQDNSVGIQIPKNWNFSVRNMTAPLPMLSPSSTLPSLSFNFPFISAIKVPRELEKVIVLAFIFLNIACVNLRN